MVTKGYYRSQRVTGVTRGYRGLHRIIRGYGGYKGLQGVTGGYKGLQGVTKGYKGLQSVTGVYRRLRSLDLGELLLRILTTLLPLNILEITIIHLSGGGY